MTLKVSSVQFQHRANDKEYNLGRIAAFTAQAASEGSQLAAFPEMCIGGYWHVPKLDAAALRALAEPLTGPSISYVSRLAREHGIAIGAGFLELSDNGELYNSYAVSMPNGHVHCHRKLHAWEHPLIQSGNSFTVFDTPWGVRAGILICWDNNLIENARANALLGAEMLIAPHQAGGGQSVSPHGMKRIPVEKWQRRQENPAAIEAEIRGPNGREWLLRWLPSRAHDNGMFLIFSNGIGQDEDEVRTGNAMVLDPYGRILVETWQAADAIVTTEVDLALLDKCTGQRWIRGRRPELYGILTRPNPKGLSPMEARYSQTSTRSV
ncbi:putative amidohydrolase [Devosia subaequoris]|uniref:Putative amidohydrolase n=1 Tax=Devosia subaequoris TaxID=395930 RepID=A0A7W6NCD9_9HYPH|nr:nitrilase family protein [Devosia subaequoris]MBB4052679.1 putative amidohydrolase [Devosia subaequoris]MCP1209834.1 nitrilase family protein [Devosia subaequoris]